jgi:hypothetical protein
MPRLFGRSRAGSEEEIHMERRAFITVLATGVFAAATRALAQGGAAPSQRGQQPRWGEQAENEFRLGRGLGPQLMTEEEWKEHQAKMRSMTSREREDYRREVHEKMVERAKDKGIAERP